MKDKDKIKFIILGFLVVFIIALGSYMITLNKFEAFTNQNIEQFIINNIKLIDADKNCSLKLNNKRNYCDCNIVDENKEIIVNKINTYFNNNSKQHIPKIIHQIWIGPKKRPDKWLDLFRKDFVKKYPDWQHMLWDDEKIRQLDFLNKDLYYKEKSYNGKSDILRYSLLYKYGGIYIDADTAWLGKPLDELLEKTNETNFFIGREMKGDNGLASGTVGVSKENPIIYYMINVMSKIYDKCKNAPAYKSIGPFFCDQVLSGFNITIFPYYYFYPIHWVGKNNERNNSIEKIRKKYPDSYLHQYGFTTNNL